MHRYRPAGRLLIGPILAGLAGCAAQPTATGLPAQLPAVETGTARVWFLRVSDPLNGNVEAARPMVFADRMPVGRSPAGTAFFHDFPPGTYSFTVEPYGGLPIAQADTITLLPGTQTYLQVQWLPSWQLGFPEAAWSANPNTFGVVAMPAEVARAYLPTLTYLGQR